MDKLVEERVGVNEEAITTLKTSDTEQWEAINKLRNRLPNWGVFLIAGLSAVCGWCLHYAAIAAKLAQK